MFLNISTIIISIASLLVPIINFIIDYKKNKSIYLMKSNTKVAIEMGINNYFQNLTHLVEKDSDSTFSDLDLAENLRYLNDILVSVYPTAKFRISIKIIAPDNNSSDLLAINYISYYDKQIKNIETTQTRIKDNTDFSSILCEGREFFFVTDIKEFVRIKEYKNSTHDYIQKWTSSIVFPIKKNLNSNTRNIIGFLCIDSINSLNNAKKNEILMKTLETIAASLYPVLESRHL